MKIRTLTAILAFLASTVGVFGQEYSFKVLANKGNNEVKSGDTWQPIKTGATLRSADEVRLSDNAYIGLVHNSGKPVELKTAGSYKVSELSAKVGKGSSVLNKYTDFILSSNSAEAKKNRLSATGAVHRATETEAIKLSLPANQYSGVFGESFIVNWDATKVAGPYVVILKNMFEDELAKIETPENSVKIDLTDPKLAAESAILIEVMSKEDAGLASKQHLIKKLTPAELVKVKTSLVEVVSVMEEESALNKLILAGFYEEHNLYIDAISAYEEAIKMAPDVPTYKEAYDEFLLRQGLKK